MRKVCELESCGIEFEAKREDARFHSAVCRAKASRERREAGGPDPGPTERDEDPDVPPDNEERLRALEDRMADLQADIEAVERTDDVVRDLARRVAAQEAAVRRAVQEAIAPIVREVAALKAGTASRAELLDIGEAVEGLGERISNIEAAPVPEEDRKLAEVERAVITLANRVRKLRTDIDALVAAINAE
jgi:chromosome segregation ATPase